MEMGGPIKNQSSVNVTGTAGAGFLGLPKQSAKPSNPGDGIRLYADASGRLSRIGENGQVLSFDSFVRPEDYGAVGNGTADDTLAIRAAITDAGAGGVLQFTPGKTYLLSGSLTPLQGQTWIGYGAKLKRRNALSTTTATAITTGVGSTTVVVADPNGFAVGMDVGFYNGATYDTHNHRITAISGNNVTVGTAFDTAFPSGATMVTSFSQIATSASGVKIFGLELDGNKANNTALRKWELHNEIYISSDYGSVENCYIHDAQSEGIQCGGVAIAITKNVVADCNGNGIHFSGSSGGSAERNYVKNCNLFSAAGHADGCIIFSNSTGDSFIRGNYCENGISGVGSIDSDDNSSVIITDNIIRSCTSYGIEGVFPSTNKGGKVVIEGNLIYDSVLVSVQYTGTFSTSYGPYNWVIANNLLSNTRLTITNGFGLSITNNEILCPTETALVLINAVDIVNCLISGNTLEGGVNGIYLDGSNSEAVKISGNLFRNNYSRGVNISAHSGRGVSVEGNTFTVQSSYTTSSYYGIVAQNNTSVLNNVMDLQVTSGQSGISCPGGGSSVNGAIVTGNVIRSSGMTYAIRAAGGSQNNWIVNNYTQQSVSNGGGASNTVAGNYTIY